MGENKKPPAVQLTPCFLYFRGWFGAVTVTATERERCTAFPSHPRTKFPEGRLLPANHAAPARPICMQDAGFLSSFFSYAGWDTDGAAPANAVRGCDACWGLGFGAGVLLPLRD